MLGARPDLRALDPEVHVLVAYALEGGRLVSPEYDTPEFKAEVTGWFTPLGLACAWHEVTLATIGDVVNELAARRDRPVVAFNLCDGFETDGYPGVSVVTALAAAAVPFTGGDAPFYRTSSSKLAMKERFRAAEVRTAPWLDLSGSANDVEGIAGAVGYPAIIKLSDACAGHGLGRTSVVANAAEARAQVAHLHEQGLSLLGIFAERFLPGRECTVLVCDAPWKPAGVEVFPAVEMVYDTRVPLRERILFENHRSLDPEGRPRTAGSPARCVYATAPEQIRAPLGSAAAAAYRAVGGNGYARVDLRYDAAGSDIYALEVNTNPELSRVAPTIAPALAAAGVAFETLIADMLGAAILRSQATP